MSFRFTKMQGLGNDFVVIDATRESFALSAETIAHMADRRFGIGFDQMLVLTPPMDKNVDFNLRIFNADGSEVGQCGNGARCIARYISTQQLSKKKHLVLKTTDSCLSLFLEKDHQVLVDMGSPKFDPQEIPYLADTTTSAYSLLLDATQIEFNIVNVGNPHAVIQVKDIEKADVVGIGSKFSIHPNFPLGTNVGFMQIISPTQVKLRVYERGAAETLACGSGACAAVAIGRRLGLLDEKVQVSQRGGNLTIIWDRQKSIKMKGPAEFVYQGEWLE